MKDLYNGLSVEHSIKPGAYTASTTGTGVDLQGYEGAMIAIDAGTWTDGSHAFEVQESDDNSTFTAVADTDLQGTEPTVSDANTDDQVYRVGYLGTKRYVRVVSTVTGATTGANYAAVVIKGFPRKAPAA